MSDEEKKTAEIEELKKGITYYNDLEKDLFENFKEIEELKKALEKRIKYLMS